MAAQNSTHNALIFRLLLKITVDWIFYVLIQHLFGAPPGAFNNLKEMFEVIILPPVDSSISEVGSDQVINH